MTTLKHLERLLLFFFFIFFGLLLDRVIFLIFIVSLVSLIFDQFRCHYWISIPTLKPKSLSVFFNLLKRSFNIRSQILFLLSESERWFSPLNRCIQYEWRIDDFSFPTPTNCCFPWFFSFLNLGSWQKQCIVLFDWFKLSRLFWTILKDCFFAIH